MGTRVPQIAACDRLEFHSWPSSLSEREPVRRAFRYRSAKSLALTLRVPLNRALSKLGILSRATATAAIRAGRVRVDGRIVHEPAFLVVPERVRIVVDGQRRRRAPWRTILLHKPRGVVTTRRDPDGRRTDFDLVGEESAALNAVGRPDL